MTAPTTQAEQEDAVREALIAFLDDRYWQSPEPSADAADALLAGPLATLRAERDQLAADLRKAREENDHLRASLANGPGPCAYCSLPREDWAKCRSGFPGCGRADDAMLCPEVGAWLEYGERLSSDAAVEAACDAFFSDPVMT